MDITENRSQSNQAQPKSQLEFQSKPPRTERYNFSLTHPKNYFGATIAMAMEEPVEIIAPEYLVKMAGETTRGAEKLGLATRDNRLTNLGKQYVNTVNNTYDTLNDGFHAIANTTHSQFIEAIPDLKEISQQVFVQYPSTAELISLLRNTDEKTLRSLAKEAIKRRHTNLSSHLFDQEVRYEELSEIDFKNTDTYNSTFTYQFKSLLCHVGILSIPGVDTSNLNPQEDMWTLSDQLAPQFREPMADVDINWGWE